MKTVITAKILTAIPYMENPPAEGRAKSFFKNAENVNWKPYPESKLTGKYIGHQLRFFNMRVNQIEQAKALTAELQKSDFAAELKKANDKPSILVDLTASLLELK